MEVVLGPVHIVLDGDTAPLPKTGKSPPKNIFGPSLLWPNGWVHQDATWYGGRPRPTLHCVQCGPRYLQKKGTPTRACVNACTSTTGNGLADTVACRPRPASHPHFRMDQDGTWHGDRPWSSPHCARWGHSSPTQKGAKPPSVFGSSLLWPNGWMHQYATWYGGRPLPRRLCVR